MIRNIKHKGLKELFLTGSSRKVAWSLNERILRRLDVLEHCEKLEELNIPGFNFHGLLGKPKRYSIHAMEIFALPLDLKRDRSLTLI